MKKVFTLILALTVVFAGFSQVRQVSKNDAKKNVATMKSTRGMEDLQYVQSESNMLRWDFGQGELDYTTYDWQTNASIINRTIVWPDGKVNFAFTYSSTSDFADRGTAIGTYDSNTDEWTPCGGRIEDEKTGFGSIARYRDNGIVVAAHTATQCGFYIIEDKDNIPVNSVSCALRLDPTVDPCWPVVMTSGPNRDIIHIIATGYSDNRLYYFRSSDGENWDKENVVLPYLTEEYGSDFGSNVAYWMETTDDNCLALVIANAWSDCMVIYSYDDGETWERKVFWHHPGINTTFEDWFMYPRWASAQWGVDGELCVAYEFNGSTGEPASGSYYPALGGVAFWSENMPYRGETAPANGVDPTNPMPPTPGNPFIMDSAYIFEDIYASWWLWSDATHEMWPEYMGYLAALGEDGQPEPDPYNVQEFNIEDRSLHGPYNCGCVAMPTLCKVPGSDSDLVAVWSALDEHHTDGTTADNYYFKLFASYSGDGGLTWAPQIQLTTDFMFELTEFVYLQAAVIDHTLIVAAQADGEGGTFVQGDETDADNNLYLGLTFNLDELFPGAGVGVPEVSNTHMTLFPNPAVDQLNVTLNQSAGIVIYNIMGQAVMNVEGHIGANSINISELNAGVYFISAGNETLKFVVK